MAPASKVKRGVGADLLHKLSKAKAGGIIYLTDEEFNLMTAPPRDPLLAAREHTHGLFEHQGAYAYELKVFLRNSSGYENLRKDQREALDMIATKISRLLHGNPKTKDTWADIAGYAKLGEEACD